MCWTLAAVLSLDNAYAWALWAPDRFFWGGRAAGRLLVVSEVVSWLGWAGLGSDGVESVRRLTRRPMTFNDVQ